MSSKATSDFISEGRSRDRKETRLLLWLINAYRESREFRELSSAF